jgi:hypothetical protein
LLKKDFLGYIFDQAIIAAKKVGPDPDTTIEKKIGAGQKPPRSAILEL